MCVKQEEISIAKIDRDKKDDGETIRRQEKNVVPGLALYSKRKGSHTGRVSQERQDGIDGESHQTSSALWNIFAPSSIIF